jgi:hypothetical protein
MKRIGEEHHGEADQTAQAHCRHQDTEGNPQGSCHEISEHGAPLPHTRFAM